ncbi:dynein heavy chain 3, axonemal [Trichonephila clavipes]|nr:dynein heavy chain 3, axonemal [Trichonephila clavipes]
MNGTGKWDKFKECRCDQNDVSTRVTTYPQAVEVPQGLLLPFCSMHRTSLMFPYRLKQLLLDCVAVPATVSRCGMIYMEATALGWEPKVQSWMNVLPEVWGLENMAVIYALCSWLIPSSTMFLRKNCKELVVTSDSHLVDSFLKMVEIVMNEACSDEEAVSGADKKIMKCWIIGAFMFATVWSFGATCDEEGREKFSNFLKELTIGEYPNYPIPPDVGMKIDCTFPKEGSVYDYKFLVSIFSG